MLKQFISFNRKISNLFDANLPELYTKDGYNDFTNNIIKYYIKPNQIIYDIGGGKNPHFPILEKKNLNLVVHGIDISSSELEKAPIGCYDSTTATDICSYKGSSDGDIIICKALLEHVTSTKSALISMSTIISKNGRVLLFIPSRNAVFARINLLLPNYLKQKLLYFIYPETKKLQGFKAYYNNCTPSSIKSIATNCNFTVEKLIPYYQSSYFKFFFPLHFIWRLWVILFRFICRTDAAESFVIVLKK